MIKVIAHLYSVVDKPLEGTFNVMANCNSFIRLFYDNIHDSVDVDKDYIIKIEKQAKNLELWECEKLGIEIQKNFDGSTVIVQCLTGDYPWKVIHPDDYVDVTDLYKD